MRSGTILAASAIFLVGVALTVAQQTSESPWHINNVAKLNTARGSDTAVAASPHKFLHVEVKFNVPADEQKKYNFKVTDARGEEVGELRFFNDLRSLVVFEGRWDNLNDLYLDANGHREPLWQTAPVHRPVVQPYVQPSPVVRPSNYVTPQVRTYVDYPKHVYRDDYRGGNVVIHDDYRRNVVVHDDRDDVVVHHRGGDTKHVYVGGGDKVVHHVDGGDVTHVYEGSGGGSESSSGTAGAGPGPGPGPGPDGGEGCEPGEGSGEGCEKCSGTGVCAKCEGKGCAACEQTGKCPACAAAGECEKCEQCGGTKICPKCEGKGCAECKDSGQCPACSSPGEAAPCPQCKGTKVCPKCEGQGCQACEMSGTCPFCKGSGCAPGEGCGPGGAPGCGPDGTPGCGSGPGACEPGGECKESPFRRRLPGQCDLGRPGNYGQQASGSIKGTAPNPERIPAFVLYATTGDETGPGKVYQVNEHGRVLGWVNTPYTPTGIALHRDNGLAIALPRDGGKVMRVDDTGKLSTLFEKDENVVHPTDVAIGGKSDTVLVADNIADTLSATSTGGRIPKMYHRMEGQKWSAQDVSIAITNDKHVILGTDGGAEGIFRMGGDDHSAKKDPLLPGPGGVAADPKSLRWAATQEPNQIFLFEGEELIKKLRLPPGKSHYRKGMLSFSPSGNLVVAARDSQEAVGEVWFLQYRLNDDEAESQEGDVTVKGERLPASEYIKAWDSQKTEIRSLFPWTHETMTDFVVGPRMFWDRSSKESYKSTY